MPGATPVYGIPYPVMGDPITSSVFKTFADAVEGVVAGTQVAVEARTNAPSARVSASMGIAAASGVLQTLTWDTVVWDLGPGTDMATAGSANVRIPFDGVFHISASDCQMSGMATLNLWDHQLLLNGAVFYQATQRPTTAGSGDVITFGGLWPCRAGDIITLALSYYGTGAANFATARLTVTLVTPWV